MIDFVSRQTIQIITMSISLIGAVLIGLLIRRRPAAIRMYLVGMLIYLAHVATYYMVVLFFDWPINLMAWSAVVRLHGVIMVFTSAMSIAHCKRGVINV